MKGLEALAYLSKNGFLNIPIPQGNESDEYIDDYAIDCGYTIEKELKALKIIKEKATIIDCRKNAPIAICIGNLKEITEKEYELLKEVLK